MEKRTFTIHLLGPFKMASTEVGSVTFPARTASAVLAYLALNKGRPTTRRELAETFWPDHEPGAALTNLRTALHRVRKVLPDPNPLQIDDEFVRLNLDLVSTDIEEADRLHRTFLLASNQPDGIAAIEAEWQLRKKVLLEGWEFEWVEAYRVRAELVSSEVGCELAKYLEANGQAERALAVLLEVLERVPHHAEAMQQALRLQYHTNGKEKALQLATLAVDTYRGELGIEMPLELQKMVKAIRSGFLEAVPKPELIRTRRELLLLARMFESNLRANGTEALAMLASESSAPSAMAHPRTTLSLLNLALSQTEGASPERMKVALQAVYLASWSSEFQIGHQWSQFVLDNTSEDDVSHGHALSMKGFMYFEQRRYELAEESIQRSVDFCERCGRQDDARRFKSRLAGVWWHQLKFKEAQNAYETALAELEDRTDQDSEAFKTMLHGNLAFVYNMVHDWTTAIVHGRQCAEMAGRNPIYSAVYPAPLGLALLMGGEKLAGIEELSRAVSLTYREGMWRFNQIAVDFAAIALAQCGAIEGARCVLQANTDHRAILQHYRSPAEAQLVEDLTGYNPDRSLSSKMENPLKGQSAGTLSQWVCEELARNSRVLTLS